MNITLIEIAFEIPNMALIEIRTSVRQSFKVKYPYATASALVLSIALGINVKNEVTNTYRIELQCECCFATL